MGRGQHAMRTDGERRFDPREGLTGQSEVTPAGMGYRGASERTGQDDRTAASVLSG